MTGNSYSTDTGLQSIGTSQEDCKVEIFWNPLIHAYDITVDRSSIGPVTKILIDDEEYVSPEDHELEGANVSFEIGPKKSHADMSGYKVVIDSQ